MNKKLMTVLCVLSLTVSVTGCSAKNKDTTSTNNNTANTTTQIIDTTKSEEIKDVDTYIKFGDSISVKGEGATVKNNVVTISTEGTYNISGELKDGQIIVDVGAEDKVQLQLNNTNLSCSNSAPIYVKSAKKVVLALIEGTKNTITDGKEYVFEDSTIDEPNAAIYSKGDLTIIGTGSLVVNANYNNGITSKDDLKIEGGQIAVSSVADGLRGKDSITILDGKINIDAKEDGIKSSNAEEADKGYIHIAGGTLNITSGQDAIQAENDAVIADGEITIDSLDDSIHANDSITINGGNISISSGNDGLNADSKIEINGGEINITKSYEGIESQLITINDGNIHLVASDDGINVGGGNDDSETRPGENNNSSSSTGEIVINGGYTVVDATGDGIDANGSITIKGGTTIVNGPQNGGNGALDYDDECNISGGILIAAGSIGMAQSPSSTSTQNSVNVALSSQSANTIIHIEDEQGNEVITFAPSKQYQSVVVSSPKLETGSTYIVSYGGSSTGEVKDGLYSGGKYSLGTESDRFTVADKITNLGSVGIGNIRGPRSEVKGSGTRSNRNENIHQTPTEDITTNNTQTQ